MFGDKYKLHNPQWPSGKRTLPEWRWSRFGFEWAGVGETDARDLVWRWGDQRLDQIAAALHKRPEDIHMVPKTISCKF